MGVGRLLLILVDRGGERREVLDQSHIIVVAADWVSKFEEGKEVVDLTSI